MAAAADPNLRTKETVAIQEAQGFAELSFPIARATDFAQAPAGDKTAQIRAAASRLRPNRREKRLSD